MDQTSIETTRCKRPQISGSGHRKASGLATAVGAAEPLAAPLMKETKLIAYVGQAHLPGDNLMAEGAAIFLELLRFLPLLRRSFSVGQLIYDIHIRQQRPAPRKWGIRALNLVRQNEFMRLVYGVARIAAIGLQDKLRDGFGVLAGRSSSELG